MSTKGILDPWRVVDSAPSTPESGPRPVRERMNVGDVDRDEDLRVANRSVFRSAHGSIEVHSARVASADDALRELVACLFELTDQAGGDAAFADLGIGFSLGGRVGGATPQEGAFSGLATPRGAAPAASLNFYGQPYDSGFLRLVRHLGAVRPHRGAIGETILKRRGVTPLLR